MNRLRIRLIKIVYSEHVFTCSILRCVGGLELTEVEEGMNQGTEEGKR